MRVDDGERIDLLNVDIGTFTQLLPNALLIGRTDSRHVMFVLDNVLMAVEFDARRRTVSTGVPVAQGFAYDTGPQLPQIAISH